MSNDDDTIVAADEKARRARWHSASWWTAVGSIAGAVAVLVAVVAWWFPRSSDSPTSGASLLSSTSAAELSTSSPPIATTGSVSPSLTTSSNTPTALPGDARQPVYIDKKVILPPTRCGVFYPGIDFDEGVVYSEVSGGLYDIVDLAYHSCASYFAQEGEAFIGIGPETLPTPDLCASAAKAQPIGELGELTVKPGQAWCIVTSSGQVAWAKITRVTSTADNSYVGVDLAVTLWAVP